MALITVTGATSNAGAPRTNELAVERLRVTLDGRVVVRDASLWLARASYN